ncbi:SMI1/KNR4 family protein [Kitasatospora sp. NPDC048239]|uniref:SMI1/KNR4 family protein n=1 Tax=Kitasatospora sp. NPDC048239 TaxID=3364046 RepID=UPI00372452D3
MREQVLALGKAPFPENVFGARWQGSGHRFLLDPPLTESEVAEAEEELDVSFPAAYRRFLLEVGAGGAGPHYGIFPLRRDGQGWHWDEGGGGRSVNALLTQPFPSEAERARPQHDRWHTARTPHRAAARHPPPNPPARPGSGQRRRADHSADVHHEPPTLHPAAMPANPLRAAPLGRHLEAELLQRDTEQRLQDLLLPRVRQRRIRGLPAPKLTHTHRRLNGELHGHCSERDDEPLLRHRRRGALAPADKPWGFLEWVQRWQSGEGWWD